MKRFINKFVSDETTTLAASLAFYTVLSLAPLVIMFVTVSSFIGPEVLRDFLLRVREVMGDDVASAISMVVASAKTRPDLTSLAGSFGAMTLLLSASLIFGELRRALNRIFEVPASEPPHESYLLMVIHYLRSKIFQMGLAASFILVLIASLIASGIITAFVHSDVKALATMINIGVSLLFFVVLFTLMFRFLPDRRQSWGRSLEGGALTALLFVAGKELIGVYLGRSAISSAYGAAGSLIALLIWVYYSTLITFVGAHVSALLRTPSER